MERNFKHFPFLQILHDPGIVTSPNYPGNYSDIWKTETIEVEEGLILSLHFTAFDIQSQSSNGRCLDYLTITDGDGTTLMERSCGSSSVGDLVIGDQSMGSSLPPNVTSTSNIVKLVFSTNGLNTRSGWSVSWGAVTPGECQQRNLVNFPF